MTVEGASESLNKTDAWDLFWSEYMVWSLRLVCYTANEFFFRSIRLSLEPNLPRLSISILLLAYSVGCLYLIEKLFARRYNPTYDNLSLTSEELQYRVGRERLIYSAVTFNVANIALGAVVATILATPLEAIPIIYGVAGVIVTIIALFIGIICMVARSTKTRRRMPYLYPIGLTAFLVPVAYIVFAVNDLHFSTQAPAW